MYGWLTFYHHGHEVAKDYKPHMTELQTRIQKVKMEGVKNISYGALVLYVFNCVQFYKYTNLHIMLTFRLGKTLMLVEQTSRL